MERKHGSSLKALSLTLVVAASFFIFNSAGVTLFSKPPAIKIEVTR